MMTLVFVYKYDFDNFYIGFKLDFTSYGGYILPYTYELNNSPLSKGFISSNSIKIETPIYIQF